MAGENDLSGKVGLDTTSFKTGVSDLNAQIRSIETGFRASAAVMGNWSSTSNGLTERTTSLADKLTLQKQKLELLNSEYKKAVDEEGANSKAVQSLANQMFSAEKAITSTESDLKKYDTQLKDVDETSKKIDFSSLKDGFAKVGSGAVSGLKAAGTAIVGMGAAVAGAAAGMGKMVMSAAESADAIQTSAEIYGLSAERIQELTYAGTKLDVGLDTITGAQSKLTKAMFAAQSGTKASVAAFSELGISATDANGNLRDSKVVMGEAFDALGKMSNETERDALSMKIFGKSAMELNPLIKAGSAELANLSSEAHKNGAVISNESIAALDKFADSSEALKLSFKGLTGNMAIMVLPAFDSFRGLIQNLTNDLGAALKSGDFTAFGKTLSDGINSAIAGLTSGMAKFTPMVTTILTGLISTLVRAIPTVLPALAAGVVQIITAFVTILQQNGPMLITAATNAVITLVTGLLTALPQIMAVSIIMLTTLVNALSAQLPTLIPLAVTAVITIVQGLIGALPQLIQAAIQMVIALIQGLMNALPQLIAAIPTLIIGIINALVQALPMLISAAPQIIVSIIMGIIKAIPQLVMMVPQIIVAVIGGLIQAIPQLLMLGPQILWGIWNGLKNQDWGKIGSDILKGLFDGMMNVGKLIGNVGNSIMSGFKSFFGIKSPSTMMRDMVGTNLGLGIVDGIKSTVGQAAQAMQSLTDVGSGGISIPVTGAFGTSGGGGTMQQPVSTSNSTTTNQIIFQGNYSFSGQKDIDYFMNQAALLAARRKG